MILKNLELYYLISMYIYYLLTLFLVLVWKFDQKKLSALIGQN